MEQLRWAKSVRDRVPVLQQRFPDAAFDEIMNEARELVPSSVAEILQALKADLARYFHDDDSKAVKQERAHFHYTGNNNDLRRAQGLIQEAWTLTEEQKLAGLSASSVQLPAGRGRVIPPRIIEYVEQPMEDVLDVSEGSVSPAKLKPVAKKGSGIRSTHRRQQRDFLTLLKDMPILLPASDDAEALHTKLADYFLPERVQIISDLKAEQLQFRSAMKPSHLTQALQMTMSTAAILARDPSTLGSWVVLGLQLANLLGPVVERLSSNDRSVMRWMVMESFATCCACPGLNDRHLLADATAGVLNWLRDAPERGKPRLHVGAKLQYHLVDALKDSVSTVKLTQKALLWLQGMVAFKSATAQPILSVQDPQAASDANATGVASAGNGESAVQLQPSRVDPSMLLDDPASAVRSGDKRVRTDKPEQLESPAKKAKQ